MLGDNVTYAYQEELLGTGHTVMQAIPYLENKKGKVVILYGDVPIVRKETLKKLIDKSIKEKEDATVEPGTILTQNREPKSKIYKNTSLVIEVAKKPAVVEKPKPETPDEGDDSNTGNNDDKENNDNKNNNTGNNDNNKE